MTFPRSHSMDVADQSSACLDPDPVFPPIPSVLSLPSITHAGAEARLWAMLPRRPLSLPQPGFSGDLTGLPGTQLELLVIWRTEALPPRASHQSLQRRTLPFQNHPGGEPRLGFLIQANSLLILIGGFA